MKRNSVWLIGLLLNSCGGTKDSHESQVAAGPEHCGAPQGSAAQEIQDPTSTLSVTLDVSAKRLQKELGKQVPKVLARESGRSIGAPGRLNYLIERTGIRVDVRAKHLLVSTQLRGQVRVCKPLGPICARYGSCKPAWTANVSLPLDWAEPATADTRVKLKKGCVLRPVGYDATREIKKITTRETRKVQARINRELKRAQRRLMRDLARGVRPIELASSDDERRSCVGLNIDAVNYSLRRRTGEPGKGLSAVIQFRGGLNAACSARTALPTPAFAESLSPKSELVASESIRFDQLSEILSQSAGAPVKLLAVAVEDGKTKRNQLHVGVPIDGRCGVRWLRAVPTFEEGGFRLVSAAEGPAATWLNAQLIPEPKRFSAIRGRLTGLQSAESDTEALTKRYDVKLTIQDRQRLSIVVAPDALEMRATVTGIASAKAL